MKKQPWWKQSVVYQIYPRSFRDSNGDGIGDIQGIIEKLDYLEDLGVDVIWLSPVYDSPNDDNGYDIRDYQEIMQEFGTKEDVEQLIQEMHKRNLKLVMDLVVNHTSDEHSWFMESRQSKDNEKRDYYIWKSPKKGEEPTNWESAFSGSAWEWDEQTGEYYLHLFSRKQPDLNWEYPKLREEVYQMMRWWLDKGIDGFRMDVINLISKDQNYPEGESPIGKRYAPAFPFVADGPRIHEFLQEMNKEVLQDYDIMTVGEMPGVTIEEAQLYTGEERKELNMVFHFDHMGVGDGAEGKWSPRPWELTELKQIMSAWQYGLESSGWNSLYWNNHDQPRAVSRFGDDGEYREQSAKMLALCLHGMKGTPYIYQGEEIGMTNVSFPSIQSYKDIETLNWFNEKKDKDNKEKDLLKPIHERGRDNARTPMQWNERRHAGFTTGTPWIEANPNYKQINVENALANKDSIFYFYKQLIALRKSEEILIHGDFQEWLKEDEAIYAYTRTWQDTIWLIVCNFTSDQQSRRLPEELGEGKQQLIITNESGINHRLPEIELQPYEAFIYSIKK